MISADEVNAVRIANFERQEKEECFDGVETTVDEVTKEKVGRVRCWPASGEELEKIEELAMYVTTYLCNASTLAEDERSIIAYGDGRIKLLHIRLLDEDFARLDTKALHLFF